MLRKILSVAIALTLPFAFLTRPAEAFRQPVTVVDRTALTLTYLPISNSAAGGGYEYNIGLSYAVNRSWDFLLSTSWQGYGSNSAYRFGARYHLPPPNPNLDVYLTAQYANDSVGGVGTTGYLVGVGVTQELAPTLKVYYTAAYQSQLQVGFFDFGAQYYVSPQWAVVGGVSTGSFLVAGFLPGTFAYFGLNYSLLSR